jgi:hypothetical protein
MKRLIWFVVPLATLGCGDPGRIEATRFTVYPLGSKCIVAADLVSTRDSSNVDLTIKACSGPTCSTPSNRQGAEGPFFHGTTKTIQYELEGCPPQPDRIVVEVSRWGSTTGLGRPVGVVDRFQKTPVDGGRCSVATFLRVLDQVVDSTVFLVARDAWGRPLDRSSPSGVPKTTEPYRETHTFQVRCELITSVDVQVVQ